MFFFRVFHRLHGVARRRDGFFFTPPNTISISG
jgi:hypothetical protein